MFSKLADITNSPDWLNLQDENGVDGNSRGYPVHEGFSQKQKELWKLPEYIGKQRVARAESYADPERRTTAPNNQKQLMQDPDYKEKCVRPMINSHKTIDHSSKEWTERSFNSSEAKAKSAASSKTQESRERSKQRELSKGADVLSEGGKSRRNKQISDGIDKYGSVGAYHLVHSEKIAGRVKIRHNITGQIKTVRDPDMLGLPDWVLVGRKVYVKLGPNPKTWYYNPTTNKIKKCGINEFAPVGFIKGMGPRKYWSREYQISLG